MQEQVLIQMSAEVFWKKMRSLIEEVLMERSAKCSVTSDPDAPRLLKVKEVCELFKISKPTIYDWIKKGQLRSIKIQSRRYFLMTDIEQLIAMHSSGK
jgi:excisionase family DNA binding protein